MCIFPKSWRFNFAVVMPHRWAGLLSMCRSFLSVLKKKREGEMKRNLLPLSQLLFSLLSCDKLCLLISVTNTNVVMCSAKDTGLIDRKTSSYIFPICHLLCRPFKCTDGEEKKKYSLIQNLHYCHLICIHMGRCILPLMGGTSQPSPCTLHGSMGCSSWCCLRWEDHRSLRLLIKSTALNCWGSWCLT